MNLETIAVGSTNPVKITAVTRAISQKFPNAKVVGVNVSSNVPEQPLTSQQTKTGSIVRAKSALSETLADIGIGLEGGVEPVGSDLYNIVWCSVINKKGLIRSVSGLNFALPQKLVTAIKRGEEMGPAVDKMIGTKNIKHKQGALGIVTGGWVTRTQGYSHLVRLALGRLLTVEWK
jgi:inosine/xanthosine triphosphatase